MNAKFEPDTVRENYLEKCTDEQKIEILELEIKNLEDKIDNLIMEYSNADLSKFVTDNYAPKDEIYKIVSNEIERILVETQADVYVFAGDFMAKLFKC